MQRLEAPSLIDRFMRENIGLYEDTEPYYDSREIDGVKCATVCFEVCGGYALCQIVDRMRKELGFKPLEPIDDEDYDTDCDQEGEYNFFIELNEDDGVEPCITAMLINSESPDNEDIYTIALTEEEQEALYRRLDEEAIAVLDMSCDRLLEKACEELARKKKDLFESL